MLAVSVSNERGLVSIHSAGAVGSGAALGRGPRHAGHIQFRESCVAPGKILGNPTADAVSKRSGSHARRSAQAGDDHRVGGGAQALAGRVRSHTK